MFWYILNRAVIFNGHWVAIIYVPFNGFFMAIISNSCLINELFDVDYFETVLMDIIKTILTILVCYLITIKIFQL